MIQRALRVAAVTGLATWPAFSQAGEHMICPYSNEGEPFLAKRFEVAAGETIVGVRFKNNDPNVLFPQVQIGRAGPTISDDALIAAVKDVQGNSAGEVELTWPQPILVVGATDFDVAIQFPVDAQRRGLGDGPAIGGLDTRNSDDSFVAGPDRSLIPIGFSLQMELVYAATDKASGTARSTSGTFLGASGLNPGSSAATIRFGLEELSLATLAVYDVAGRRVKILEKGVLDPGVHIRQWDGRDESGHQVAAGVYVVTLHAGSKQATQKVVLLSR